MARRFPIAISIHWFKASVLGSRIVVFEFSLLTLGNGAQVSFYRNRVGRATGKRRER